MSAVKTIAQLRQLREQPLWRLLASDKAPMVLGVLQDLLLGEEKVVSASVLLEKLQQELLLLKSAGEDMAQTAQAYLALWLSEGWLTRRLPAGAQEEQYELTTDAVTAIRFLQGVLQPRAMATESRLAIVMQQLTKLAEDTNPDPSSRRSALLAERARIDRELEQVGRGIVETLPAERALERARDIIGLADELVADFRRVREDFDQLNRQLRADLLNNEGSRGQVLEQLFAGMDLIGETPAGKTFYAFWRLLTDIEQATIFSESLTEVVTRDFASELGAGEKKFLRNLTNRLLDEGGNVHEVLQTFSRSLRNFVQSREYQEQRRFSALLRVSQRDALSIKEHIRPNQDVGFSLWLPSAQLRSAAQWRLYDPADRAAPGGMEDAPESSMSLQDIASMVRNSEIDFGLLRRNIYECLQHSPVVGIEELLRVYPASQGLGSVVGYIHLALRYGQVTPSIAQVNWTGMDAVARSAVVPAVYFLKEKEHEFAR
ncbi:DUF3375 domain-containing protein [Polaromonas sp. LjRoot131]|uniref:DUF3375 domain-containing protein n=1 Tax=Polaromonas sp. LjRoot131 TaxID=3342262 RepID=UPI003ECD45B8